MNRTKLNHCRFCAEPKDANKLFNLKMDTEKYQDVISKLTFLQISYVDITDDSLPKTICFICYESLNHTNEFLKKVKEAQNVISNIYSSGKKACLDMKAENEIYFKNSTTEDDEQNIKRETEVDSEYSSTSETFEPEIIIKIEPEEEIECSEFLDGIEHIPSTSHYEDNLKLQNKIETDMPGAIIPVIYAKEKSVYKKKVTNTWRDYPWLCAHCNIECQDIATLRKHSMTVHQKCLAFSCVDCNTYRLKSFNNFVKHVIKHRKNLRNQCFYCKREPKNLPRHLIRHLKSSRACPACGDIFKTEEARKQHLLKNNYKPRRKPGTPLAAADLTCKICEKVLTTPGNLQDHLKLHKNDRKKEYTCERCGKTFFYKGNLTTHMLAHDQVKPHVCRICKKAFAFLSRLQRHVTTHSVDKPFSCEQCNKCFKHKNQLKNHQVVHSDVMRHKCQYCVKAFRFRSTLVMHERLHTGAKPYSCNQCGMEFADWPNYNKHSIQRHGIDTSKKKFTPEGVFPVNPETGQVVQLQDAGMDEWKNEIMTSTKRGRKKQ